MKWSRFVAQGAREPLFFVTEGVKKMEIEAKFPKKAKKQRRRGDNGRRLLINRAALSMRRERRSQGMPGEMGAVQEDFVGWGALWAPSVMLKRGTSLRKGGKRAGKSGGER